MASSRRFILQQLEAWSRLGILGLLLISFWLASGTVSAAIAGTVICVLGLTLNPRPVSRVLLFVVIPFAFCTLLVAAMARLGGTAPTAGQAAANGVGWQDYASRFVRISGACLSISILLGCLSPNGFCQWLSNLGFSKRIAFQAASPLILLQALKRRAQTIFDARLAQGHVLRRNFFSSARQLMPVLTMLVSAGLAMAVERADIWHQDDILDLIAADNPEPSPKEGSHWGTTMAAWMAALAVAWICLLWRRAH